MEFGMGFRLPVKEFKVFNNFINIIGDSLVVRDFWDYDHTSRYVTIKGGQHGWHRLL